MRKGIVALVAVMVWVLAASGQKASDVYRGLKYDKAAEVKLSAVIEDIQDFDCPISQALGNHAILKTSDGTLVAHTAPVKFMKEYGLELTKGDSVQVIGSKVKDSNGTPTLLVREIVKDNVTLRFRDSNGKPVW